MSFLSYDPNSNPGNQATDSVYLFNTLGYFWRRAFKDVNVISGLIQGQVEAAKQAYTQMFQLIDSYSTTDIPVFERRNWYPLTIKLSDLDNNTLLFGEGVKFGDTVSSQSYKFGTTIPAAPNTYSVVIGDTVKQATFIVDQVVSPNMTWMPGVDYDIINGRVFFYANPFTRPNVTSATIYNSDGTATSDKVMILWIYNADLNSDNLKNNIGFMFGVDVPHNSQGKSILGRAVKLYTNGPTINDIKAVALASLGLPIIDEVSTIASIAIVGSNRVFTTDTGVYSYPTSYQLKSGITTGTVLQIGDVPVKAVELFDQVNKANWWQTELGVDISTPNARTVIDPTGASSSLTVQSGRALVPLELPPSMLLISSDYALRFMNTAEPVSLDGDHQLVFPVHGSYYDVKRFQNSLKNNGMLALVNSQISPILSPSNPVNVINPVDFIFKAFLKSASALLRVKFLDINQLGIFEEFFGVIYDMLPPNVLLIVLCDVVVPGDTYQMNTNTLDNSMSTYYPLQKTNDVVSFNSGSGLVIKDMATSRVIVADPITEIRQISLVVPS
jgi:hypothetical protein